MLHHVGDKITRLPTAVRDLPTATGKIESRLRRLEQLDVDDFELTPAGRHRLEWLQEFIERDRQARREIRALERQIDRLLDAHGTTLRDEDGIGSITAAGLQVGLRALYERTKPGSAYPPAQLLVSRAACLLAEGGKVARFIPHEQKRLRLAAVHKGSRRRYRAVLDLSTQTSGWADVIAGTVRIVSQRCHG